MMRQLVDGVELLEWMNNRVYNSTVSVKALFMPYDDFDKEIDLNSLERKPFYTSEEIIELYKELNV